MWDLHSSLPFPGLLSLADTSGVLNLSLDFSSLQQKNCVWVQENGFVLILPALSGEMTRKQKCGISETFLGSCPSSSMQPVGQQLKAASSRASVCKRKSCLRAQIFVLKDAEPNLTPFLHANPSWITGLTRVSLPTFLPKHCPNPGSRGHQIHARSLTTALQKAPSLPASFHPSLHPGHPMLLPAHAAGHEKHHQEPGATAGLP